MVHLYSADKAAPLARRLAEVLEDEPGDAMAPEWVAAPSDGMRRWLMLELARHLGSSGGREDGVAANVIRAYPGTLRTAVLDADNGGRPDGWHIERMVWPLLSLFDRLEREGTLPAFTKLPSGASRFTRVRSVADLFDRYHLHRPAMIRAWAAGSSVDGASLAIDPHAAWQPDLWRLLRGSIGSPSPAERLPRVLEALRSDRLPLDLPDRLVFFGFSTLPGRDFVDLVDAVGRHRDVHMFLLEPHRYDPDVLLEAWPDPAGTPRLRTSDRSTDVVRHPLLRTWARLPRETALLLADRRSSGLPEPEVVQSASVQQPTTLLARLQAGIRSDAPPVAGVVADADRSVQLHACFGPRRQVEVAKDAILHLLNQDPTLTEEDVVVVCPGLEQFAPLVEAVFGPPASSSDLGSPATGAPHLRYRIADRSMRSVNPVMGAMAALLDLAAGRFELSEVLDFISLAPVRERFRLDDTHLGILAEWADGTRVRWGLDPTHRSRFGVPPAVAANTWQSAIDRLLLGTSTSEDQDRLAIGDVAPFGVEIGDAELLGSLASVLTRLASLAEWCGGDGTGRRPLSDWVTTLRTACGDLFRAPPLMAWQTESLDRVFADLLDASGPSSLDPSVGLDLLDLRRLLTEHLDDAPGRPDFFRGGVTVTSLTPLRWVPFRVVCVLGLDQEFVGSSSPDAADLTASAPQVGDPDPRAEFRQALLEAVLAAGDHLLVIRDGRDVRSNHVVPRVVPAAELFDTLVALGADPRPGKGHAALEVTHPRHPFDEACLIQGGVVPGAVWSFDPHALDGALGRRRRPATRAPFMTNPLPGDVDDVIELDELRTFLADPVAGFLRRGLDVSLPRPAEDVDPVLPVEPNGLEAYQLGVDLLRARQAGMSDEQWRKAARARGMLPPGVLEDRVVRNLSTEVDDMVREAQGRGLRPGEPTRFPVDLHLPSGTRLIGEVLLRLEGDTSGPARIQFTRPKERNQLDAWVDLMALMATDPVTPWRSLVVTRAQATGRPLRPVDLAPVVAPPGVGSVETRSRRQAVAALEVAVDLYRRGVREPLPLFPSYSPLEYQSGSGHTKWQAHNGRGDDAGVAVRLVFGDIDVEELEAVPARPDDPAAGRPGDGRTRRFAAYLWGSVAASVEQVP